MEVEVKLVDFPPEVLNCECQLFHSVHCHGMEPGEQGVMGRPFRFWNSKHNTKITNTINEHCKCSCKKGEHVHVTTRGPQGVEGFPAGFTEEQKRVKIERQYQIAIKYCKWCEVKEPHHHIVYEGSPGPSGY